MFRKSARGFIMMNIKKMILILMLIAYMPYSIFSQTISPFVINTCGGEGNVGNVYLYYNIGETVINTISNSNNIITQGFLQPDAGKFNLLANYTITPVSCVGKEDGSIVLSKSHTGIVPQSLNYQLFWNDTLCPTNDCGALYNLAPGTYSVMIIAYDGTQPLDTVILNNLVISPSSEPCKIKVFTYISPNGDGQNDQFFIENIEEYPDNIVYIFNRWGQEVMYIENYDNQENTWGSKKYPITVPAGTYYYLIDLDGKNKNILKGFIELIGEK